MTSDYQQEARESRARITRWVIGCCISAVLLVALCMWIFPPYGVWQRRLAGEAELAQASYNRKIKIQEAAATKEAARSLADAEVIRASGVAKANQIIGESLRGNDDYLRYLWVQGVGESKGHEVIYIPTEANLPILEASRRVEHP